MTEQILFKSLLPDTNALKRIKFSLSRMMVMPNLSSITTIDSSDEIEIIISDCEKHDEVAVKSWRNMWIESGCTIDELKNDINTYKFIKEARSSLGLKYKTILAKDIKSDRIIGSLSTMLWQGESPISCDDEFIGTVWGVFVNPMFRRRGIGFLMMQACCMYWKFSGCSKGVLIYASEEGKRLYERIGFISRIKYEYDVSSSQSFSKKMLFLDNLNLIKDLREMLSKEIKMDKNYCNLGLDFTNELHLLWLVIAIPNQLHAILNETNSNIAPEIVKMRNNLFQVVTKIQKEHGKYINPDDNWFTRNLKRFGSGFDMQKLKKDNKKLASKFDQIASKYDEWVSGNKSKVENWLVSKIRSNYLIKNNRKQFKCLDISCGIGLPAHTLRLGGMTDVYIIGTDISIGMLTQANKRCVYDKIFECNANLGFNEDLPDSEYFDLIICMGAMELLNQEVILKEIARLLKKEGRAWLSFQWEDSNLWKDTQHPTYHQNVFGISIDDCKCSLENAGMKVISIDKCCNAFYTPSPKMDGTTNPVPYLFVEAKVLGNN